MELRTFLSYIYNLSLYITFTLVVTVNNVALVAIHEQNLQQRLRRIDHRFGGDAELFVGQGQGGAPKPSLPMDLTAYLDQPKVEAASMNSLHLQSDGMIDSLYASPCSSNNSRHGMETAEPSCLPPRAFRQSRQLNWYQWPLRHSQPGHRRLPWTTYAPLATPSLEVPVS